jgi:AraC-like DNA-binding protein
VAAGRAGKPGGNAARRLFARFILANLLIFAPLFLMATAYSAVSLATIRKNMDAVAAAQLAASVASVDRKLSDIRTLMDRLAADYELNRFLNEDAPIGDAARYDSRRISEKLSSLVLGGEVMSRCFVYLAASDLVIYESGFADYDSFYGPLFAVEGYGPAAWKEAMAGLTQDFAFLPGQAAAVNGKASSVHLLVRPLGYGAYRRGFIVSVIDQEELGRRLARLPGLYGGLVMAVDPENRLLAYSGESAAVEKAAAALDAARPGTAEVELGGLRYFVYRLRSPANDWTYIALAEERALAADAVRTRSIAFLLLGAGALVGLVAAFFSAFTNARPLARLFALIVKEQSGGSPDGESPDGAAPAGAGIYETVENAVLRLADDKRRLADRAHDAAAIAHLYFFQTLLRGGYRDRARFAEDRSRLAVDLAEDRLFVLVCRPSALAAVLGERERLQAADSLSRAASERAAAGEPVVSFSPGEVVLVKRWTGAADHREETAALVAYLRSKVDARFRGSLLFGVGRPVDDPFLLPLSYNEASACLVQSAERPESLHFYADSPAAPNAYYYPFDAEEALVRAVRAANLQLLDSQLGALAAANFVDRRLPPAEARNLVAALRGTAHRLIAETPGDAAGLAGRLADLDGAEDSLAAAERFAALADVLRAIAAELEKGKRSHNSRIGEAISTYVADRFADPGLGLTAIADAFGISESYLSAFYKEQSGECLSERIQRVRLSAAAAKLGSSDEPVDRIAADCGYANPASFRRAFKRFHGLAPSDYRLKRGLPAKSGPIPK